MRAAPSSTRHAQQLRARDPVGDLSGLELPEGPASTGRRALSPREMKPAIIAHFGRGGRFVLPSSRSAKAQRPAHRGVDVGWRSKRMCRGERLRLRRSLVRRATGPRHSSSMRRPYAFGRSEKGQHESSARRNARVCGVISAGGESARRPVTKGLRSSRQRIANGSRARSALRHRLVEEGPRASPFLLDLQPLPFGTLTDCRKTNELVRFAEAIADLDGRLDSSR